MTDDILDDLAPTDAYEEYLKRKHENEAANPQELEINVTMSEHDIAVILDVFDYARKAVKFSEKSMVSMAKVESILTSSATAAREAMRG